MGGGGGGGFTFYSLLGCSHWFRKKNYFNLNKVNSFLIKYSLQRCGKRKKTPFFLNCGGLSPSTFHLFIAILGYSWKSNKAEI